MLALTQCERLVISLARTVEDPPAWVEDLSTGKEMIRYDYLLGLSSSGVRALVEKTAAEGPKMVFIGGRKIKLAKTLRALLRLSQKGRK